MRPDFRSRPINSTGSTGCAGHVKEAVMVDGGRCAERVGNQIGREGRLMEDRMYVCRSGTRSRTYIHFQKHT